MNRLKSLLVLIHTRNLEFFRDTAALAWNFLFPFLVIAGFGFAFSRDSQDLFKVAHIGPKTSDAFFSTPFVQFVEYPTSDEALAKLKHHQVDMVIAPPSQYWVSPTSPKSVILERMLHSTPMAKSPEIATSNSPFKRQTVEGKEIRYVDWLIAGMLAMNIMFSALFGVGYVLVRYRKSGVLKRLKATPLKAFDFLLAQVVSRLMIIMTVSTIVFVGCQLLVKFQMAGSYFDLFIVMAFGAICLIALGLVVASASKSEEFAGGLLNMITWPMMFLSGVWFSLEGLHPWVKRIASVFPLTHVIDASRAIMNEGATLSQVSSHLAVLGILSIVFLAFGSFRFKWD